MNFNFIGEEMAIVEQEEQRIKESMIISMGQEAKWLNKKGVTTSISVSLSFVF